MIGTKIRSWMEAHIVRPRKKQHRKDITSKKHVENEIIKDTTEIPQKIAPETIKNTVLTSRPTKSVDNSQQMRQQYQSQHNSINLSSPESAYSTGYSTDGTSPGTTFPASTAAPEYYINIRTGTRYFHSSSSDVPLRLSLPNTSSCLTQQKLVPNAEIKSSGDITTAICIASPALTSPRQRNRIRTNPWVTTNNSLCSCSPMHVAVSRQSTVAQSQTTGSCVQSTILPTTSSPVRRKWSCADKKQRCMKCGACSRFEAFSSSSSSSLSVSSVHHAVTNVTGLGMRSTIVPTTTMSVASDDDDDRTLNEMMGKYDESYIYEKETDILSDSDPTDCDEEYDTDADAGREGGDECDTLTDEDDFDFIDNGPLELSINENNKDSFINMGHCTYHNFVDEQPTQIRRRRGTTDSHTPTSSRRRKPSERRSRHSSSKKRRDKQPVSMLPVLPALVPVRGYANGSRSAGATPISMRRRNVVSSVLGEPTAYLSHSVDKSRHNSITFVRRSPYSNANSPDCKLFEFDKESDKKYRELIIEAEHILMAMRTNSPPVVGSPARRSNVGPANKRVELLRNEECGGGNPNNSTVASISMDPYSPKRKHVTNFVNSNSNTSLPISKLVSAPRWPPRPLVYQHCPQSEPVKRKVYAPPVPSPDVQINAKTTAANPIFHRQKLFHSTTSHKKNSETLRHVYKGSINSQRL